MIYTKNKNSIATMESRQKRINNMSQEELSKFKKTASLASMQSRKNRLSKMSVDEKLKYNLKNNAAGKRSREKKKFEALKPKMQFSTEATQNWINFFKAVIAN